jgi:phosphatidylinositol alpha-mannosyltransferase
MAPIAPDLSAQLRLIRSLRDEKFDIVHLHEPMVPGPNVTAAVVKQSPLVGTFHAAGTSKAYDYLGPLTRWLNRRLDLRCAVSEDARRLAHEHLGGEFEMLFNGIEVDRFAKAAPWPSEGPTILFLGRHEERKGLRVLLAAMAHLPVDCKLWVAGDGPLTAALQLQHAGDARIEWLGRISDEEKASRLRGADVFCAPSIRGESFGIVLLEAMASGTPIVAGDLAGYANVARDGIEGVLVEPGDPVALAEAIRSVLDDQGLADRLTSAGALRAEQFSMSHLADRYVECYRRVLG